jgi:hypothetical protein
LTFENKKG